MKKLVNKVELEFFQDDANGEYGLAHKNAIDCETPFNAFWNSCKVTTLYEVQEAINSGYCMYGHTLNSGVYKQQPTESYDLESMVDDFVADIFKLKKECDLPTYEDEREFAINYLKSLSTTKVRDLHRYGYRMAERLVPDNEENRIELANFLEFWNVFTKKNSAEEMQYHFSGITFEIYHNELGEISWEASLHPLEWNIEDIAINSHTKHIPYIEDITIEMYDFEEEDEEVLI